MMLVSRPPEKAQTRVPLPILRELVVLDELRREELSHGGVDKKLAGQKCGCGRWAALARRSRFADKIKSEGFRKLDKTSISRHKWT